MKRTKLQQGGWSLHIILPIIAVLLVGVIGVVVLTNSNAASCKSYVYKYGSKGTCVKYIQQIYNGSAVTRASCTINGVRVYDSTTQIATDGSFGPITLSRTKAFQKSHCLAVDGSVGPKTWAKLCTDGQRAGYIIVSQGMSNTNPDFYKLYYSYNASVSSGCGDPYPVLVRG